MLQSLSAPVCIFQRHVKHILHWVTAHLGRGRRHLSIIDIKQRMAAGGEVLVASVLFDVVILQA